MKKEQGKRLFLGVISAIAWYVLIFVSAGRGFRNSILEMFVPISPMFFVLLGIVLYKRFGMKHFAIGLIIPHVLFSMFFVFALAFGYLIGFQNMPD